MAEKLLIAMLPCFQGNYIVFKIKSSSIEKTMLLICRPHRKVFILLYSHNIDMYNLPLFIETAGFLFWFEMFSNEC
jgi:hypothetical protein